MARRIAQRWVVTGKLLALTPLHVSGLTADPDTDLPLARDGAGDWTAPGTSLAGAFRSWWREAFGDEECGKLWGRLPDDDDDPVSSGWASYVIVEDATVTTPGNIVERRDGVGIDRNTGTAADRFKYDRAVLPAGTTLCLAMTVEVPNPDQVSVVEAMLGHFLDALVDGRIPLGAATTRGLGRMKLCLDELTIKRQVLNSRAGMLALLKNDGGRVALSELDRTHATVRPSGRIILTLAWEPLGPVMTRSSLEGLGVDTLPLTGRDGDSVRLLLSGAGVKGSLRAHAERIVRTVLERSAPEEFSRQLREPLVSSLFGMAEGDGDSDGKTEAFLPGRGALAVADCLSLWSATPKAWTDLRATADDQEMARRIDSDREFQGWQPTFHVAVDRWTGGAAESQLYTVLEPQGVAWQPLTLTLDLNRLPAADREAGVTLLLLVLDDLAAGRLPLGFAGNRGMGALRIRAMTTDLSTLGRAPPDEAVRAALESLNRVKPDAVTPLAALPDEARDRLAAAWGAWIERQRKTGTAVARADA